MSEGSIMKTATSKKAAPSRPGNDDYDAWFDEQVRLGLEDIDAGRVISHEEVIRHSEAQLKRLGCVDNQG
jgi:predicted transcriptional regulator